MKITNVDNNVHVLDSLTNTWNVLRDIANSLEQTNPFYIFNLTDIIQKFETWKAVLPRVEPFYSVTCNDNLTILEVLATLGLGFECASKSEINRIQSIGVSADRIYFASPSKLTSHIKYAANNNINIVTFDSAGELQKLKTSHPNANLIMSIRFDDEEAECPLGMKFGCDAISEAPELLKLAHSLDLSVVGISFHFESDSVKPQILTRAIQIAKELFDFASTLGFDLSVLDLGKGFSGDHCIETLEEMAEDINHALDICFPNPSVRIIAEPSRFLVNSAYTLACKIQSVRSVDKIDSITGDYHTHRMYFINDGVYGSFSAVLYGQHCPEPLPLNEYVNSKMYSSSIWGPTCDDLDQVIEEVVLPEMKIGDWIVFENMGAYTLPSSFNGFPIPKVHIVVDESTWDIMKDALTLTEEHFLMGNLSDAIKISKNSSVNFSMSPLPTRLSIVDNIPLDTENYFQLEHFGRLE